MALVATQILPKPLFQAGSHPPPCPFSHVRAILMYTVVTATYILPRGHQLMLTLIQIFSLHSHPHTLVHTDTKLTHAHTQFSVETQSHMIFIHLPSAHWPSEYLQGSN